MATVRKSQILLIITVLITICSFSFPAYAKYSGGTGEPNDPYQIATPEDLLLLGDSPEDYDKHFILTADIDLDPNLPGRKVFDKAVIAPDTGTRSWISFQGTSFTGVFDGNGHTISHLTITGAWYLGLFGQVASERGMVKNLGVLDVKITGEDHRVGGLAGENSGDITRCYSTGIVNGSTSVGGVVGYSLGGTLTCSFSTAKVSGSSYVGGLVGEHWGTAVTNCYSSGAVSGRSIVGGLTGGNWGTIANCYSTSKVSGTDSVGGLVGARTWGVVTDSFWDIQTSGQTTSVGGTGKTTAEMKMAVTFTNWDFEEIWTIQEGVDYPKLQWQIYGIPSPVPTTIEKLSGDNRSGRAGFKLVYPLIVLVKDQDDTPMPNIQVEFIVTEGGGIVEPALALTNSDGIASTELTLGPTPGLNQVNATVGSLSVSFNITGLAPEYGGGTGEPNDPYQIRTAEQMNVIGAVPNDWDKHFKLVEDIDLSGLDGKEGRPAFNIIGTSYDIAFSGVFEGNGHTISHLTITGEKNLGLFGYLGSGAEVKDVGIVDVNVTGSGNYVGGLVGSKDGGAVYRCYSTGAVSGNRYVGGLVGENHGNITHSYSTASVSGSYAGGLVGWNYRSVTNSYSTGMVSGSYGVGGLVGDSGLSGATVLHCVWDTDTSGQTTSAGGVGLTTAEMMDPNMLGLNGFANDPNWVLDAGRDYPRLAWEGTPGQKVPEANMDWLAGQGTTQSPYTIETADQFLLLSRASSLWEKQLVLGADIDLDPNLPNIPVFTQSPIQVFTGVFDGNYHTISHLTIKGVSYVGLFGRLKYRSEVRNLAVEDVNVSGYSYVGGLVGISDGGRVNNCYSSGTVTPSGQGTAGFYVGGLVGYNCGPVTGCYTAGTVSGTQWSIGGLIGYGHGRVQQCYSTAAVNGGWRVGGLVGEHAGQMVQCYSTGRVQGIGGGLVGYNYFWSEVINSFWDIQTSGRTTSAGGIGKTTVEMQMQSTFTNAGWDFIDETANGTEDIWWILEGKDYPRLWWELIEE